MMQIDVHKNISFETFLIVPYFTVVVTEMCSIST